MPQSKKYLGKEITAHIDRPLGSKHPTHGFEYMLNYGYIPNTLSSDGEELDAYILGVNTPLEKFTGLCIAIIQRLDDDDDKLILAPQHTTFSDEEIRTQTNFQEKFFSSIIIR